LAGIANTVFSIAIVLQYFYKISIGIGIGNTIMNIGSSFLLIPIVNTSYETELQNSYNFTFVRITSVS